MKKLFLTLSLIFLVTSVIGVAPENTDVYADIGKDEEAYSELNAIFNSSLGHLDKYTRENTYRSYGPWTMIGQRGENTWTWEGRIDLNQTYPDGGQVSLGVLRSGGEIGSQYPNVTIRTKDGTIKASQRVSGSKTFNFDTWNSDQVFIKIIHTDPNLDTWVLGVLDVKMYDIPPEPSYTLTQFRTLENRDNLQLDVDTGEPTNITIRNEANQQMLRQEVNGDETINFGSNLETGRQDILIDMTGITHDLTFQEEVTVERPSLNMSIEDIQGEEIPYTVNMTEFTNETQKTIDVELQAPNNTYTSSKSFKGNKLHEETVGINGTEGNYTLTLSSNRGETSRTFNTVDNPVISIPDLSNPALPVTALILLSLIGYAYVRF